MWSYHLDLMLYSVLRRHHVYKKKLEILLVQYRYCSKQNRYTFQRAFENRIIDTTIVYNTNDDIDEVASFYDIIAIK